MPGPYDCFKDNLNRTNHEIDPEKHNLYSGLMGLAARLDDIERELRIIKALVGR